MGSPSYRSAAPWEENFEIWKMYLTIEVSG